MLELLAILVGLADLASIVFAAAKFWRLTCTLLVAASVVVLLCFIWESPIIRWVGGFHLFVAFITVGLLWESKRGKLKN